MDDKMLARFMAKVKVNEDNGCWEWQSFCHKFGYGQFSISSGHHRYAHRVAFEHFVRPIPNGLQIDHLCRNPKCCNPKHLEAVTPRENVLRSTGRNAALSKLGECAKGHKVSGDNLMVAVRHGVTLRRCKTCYSERMVGYNAIKKRKRHEAAALLRASRGHRCHLGHLIEGDNLVIHFWKDKELRRCKICTIARGKVSTANHNARKRDRAMLGQ